MNKRVIIILAIIIMLLLGAFIYLKTTAPQKQEAIVIDQPSLTSEELQDLTADHLDEAFQDLEQVTAIPS